MLPGATLCHSLCSIPTAHPFLPSVAFTAFLLGNWLHALLAILEFFYASNLSDFLFMYCPFIQHLHYKISLLILSQPHLFKSCLPTSILLSHLLKWQSQKEKTEGRRAGRRSDFKYFRIFAPLYSLGSYWAEGLRVAYFIFMFQNFTSCLRWAYTLYSSFPRKQSLWQSWHPKALLQV